MWHIILSSWKSGLRSRYFHGVAILAVLLIFVAYLASSFSPRAPRTVALDVGLSGLRFSLVLLTLLWTQETLAREIDRRTVMLVLSYPISRGTYLLGRFFGVLLLGCVAALVLALALIIAVVLSGINYEAQQYIPDLGLPFWMTILGILIDSFVVAAFALVVAAISTTPMLPLFAGAGFALAGKSFGAAYQYVSTGGDKSIAATNTAALDWVYWLLPDLSRLDWRLWPMYHMPPDPGAVMFACLSAASYALVLLSIAVVAFSRREFS
jgi:Cu-processing system permease protein